MALNNLEIHRHLPIPALHKNTSIATARHSRPTLHNNIGMAQLAYTDTNFGGRTFWPIFTHIIYIYIYVAVSQNLEY